MKKIWSIDDDRELEKRIENLELIDLIDFVSNYRGYKIKTTENDVRDAIINVIYGMQLMPLLDLVFAYSVVENDQKCSFDGKKMGEAIRSVILSDLNEEIDEKITEEIMEGYDRE